MVWESLRKWIARVVVKTDRPLRDQYGRRLQGLCQTDSMPDVHTARRLRPSGRRRAPEVPPQSDPERASASVPNRLSQHASRVRRSVQWVGSGLPSWVVWLTLFTNCCLMAIKQNYFNWTKQMSTNRTRIKRPRVWWFYLDWTCLWPKSSCRRRRPLSVLKSRSDSRWCLTRIQCLWFGRNRRQWSHSSSMSWPKSWDQLIFPLREDTMETDMSCLWKGMTYRSGVLMWHFWCEFCRTSHWPESPPVLHTCPTLSSLYSSDTQSTNC